MMCFRKKLYNIICSIVHFVSELEGTSNYFFPPKKVLPCQMVLLLEVLIEHSFQNRKSICTGSAVNWATVPLTLSNHNLELSIGQNLLQSLPEGTCSVLRMDQQKLMKANGALCSLQKDTPQHTQPPPHPITHTSSIGRFTGFSGNPTPTLDTLRSSWFRADHHKTGTGLHLPVLCEIPVITLCSGKKPLTFIEVHYKKQPHKIHHNVYCAFLVGSTVKLCPSIDVRNSQIQATGLFYLMNTAIDLFFIFQNIL